jgi:hypothetical protein
MSLLRDLSRPTNLDEVVEIRRHLGLRHAEARFHLALQIANADRYLLNASCCLVPVVEEPKNLIAPLVARVHRVVSTASWSGFGFAPSS